MFRLRFFKIGSIKIRDICFLKFGNTVKTSYTATVAFCKVKTVYRISRIFFEIWVPFYSGHSLQRKT
jgi:hypothetical protein